MSEFNFLGSVSPVYIVFSAKKNWHFFINQFIRLPSSKSKIAQLCSGSVRQSLSFEDFSSIPLLIPNEKIILKYNNVIELFRQKIKNISKENILHAELRDLIVNKIFSGDYQIDSKFK